MTNIIDVIVDYVRFTRTFGSIILFGLPLIALIAAAIRKKEGVHGAQACGLPHLGADPPQPLRLSRRPGTGHRIPG